jgi:hypothetical protein
MYGALGVMHLSYAQLVSLPRFLQTSRFSSNHNTKWRFLNPSNHNFMINPNTSKNPSIQKEDPSFDDVHAMTPMVA